MKKTLLGYHIECLTKKKYADFSGRARRAEFIGFYVIAASVFLSVLGLCYLSCSLGKSPMIAWSLLAFLGVYLLLVITPAFSVFARRLHDLNYSFWMSFPMVFIMSVVRFQMLAFILVRLLKFKVNRLKDYIPSVGQFDFLFFVVGALVSLLFVGMLACREGTKGTNQYGPNPKAKK